MCFPATAADILNMIFFSSTIRLFSAESCSEVIILCFTSICYHRNDCNNLNLAWCLSCRIKQEDWMGCMWKNLYESQNMLAKSKCFDKFIGQKKNISRRTHCAACRLFKSSYMKFATCQANFMSVILFYCVRS